MMVWKKFYGLSDYWDEALTYSENYNVFQTYVWGEFKKTTGWVPERWIASDKNGDIICMVQILIKSFPGGFKIGWASGGPVILFNRSNSKKPPEIIKDLFKNVSRTSGRMVVRLNIQVPDDAYLSYSLNQICVRPIFRINSGYTINIDLNQSLEQIRKKMSPRHRYNLKKSLEENIDWKYGNNPMYIQDFLLLNNEMVNEKKVESIRVNLKNITELSQLLGENVIFFAGYIDNVPIASCLVLIFGQKAFHFMASSGLTGRKLKASYAMNYSLLKLLKEKGIRLFDFGGIDPYSPSAAGVNSFKKGFGGELVEYLGEWEWASSGWVKWVVNSAIRINRGWM